jgi:hypothetical protein
VPAVVHLEEAVLRLDVALGPEEVLGRVRVDLRDALRVAEHRDLALQARELDLTRRLRQRPADRDDDEGRPGDERQHDQHGDRDQDAAARRPAAPGRRSSGVGRARGSSAGRGITGRGLGGFVHRHGCETTAARVAHRPAYDWHSEVSSARRC